MSLADLVGALSSDGRTVSVRVTRDAAGALRMRYLQRIVPMPTWEVGGRRRVQVVIDRVSSLRRGPRVVAQHLTTFAGRTHVLHGITRARRP